MKRLDELVQEEIGKFYPMPALFGGNAGDLAVRAQQKKDAAFKRISEDKALGILVSLGANMIAMISNMTPAGVQRNEATAQILIELVTIWENSHNAFNDQLKSQP